MELNELNSQEIFSRKLRAGRRTYFFDVKSTRAEDYYLTITESKKHTNDDEVLHFLRNIKYSCIKKISLDLKRCLRR